MREVELGEVASYQNGYAFKPNDWSTEGIPIIRIQNLNDPAKDYNYYKGDDVDEKYFVQDGDVLIAWSASLGVYVWNRGDAWLNQHTFKVNFENDEVDKSYFVYAIQEVLKKIENKLHGSTMKHITKTKFLKLKIPLPSLSEQKAIVAKLDRAQRLIDIDREMFAKYDELIQSVFLEMFGDPVTNSKDVPKQKIKDIGEVVTGNTPPKKNPKNYGDAIEWVKTTNIVEEKLYPTKAEEYLSESGKERGRIIPVNSLIVCCIAGSLSSIGKCSIVDREVAINQQINAIVPNSEIIDTTFLYAQLLVGKKFIQDASTKSMKGMVSKSKFQKIELLVPKLSDQQKFSVFFKKVGKEKLKLRSVSKKSEELFLSLVQGAFG